jgi:uncharacterized protein (DUF1330 family)
MSDSSSYMIVTCRMDPNQKQHFGHYVTNARPIFARFGGRPAGQYAIAEKVVGSGDTTHVLVMTFPSADAIKGVMADPEYQALIPARTQAFPTLDIMIATDFAPPKPA